MEEHTDMDKKWVLGINFMDKEVDNVDEFKYT